MRRLLTCWTSVAVGAGMGMAAAGQWDGGRTIHATTTPKTETTTPSLPDVDLKVAPPAAHTATSSPIATGPDGPASPLRLQLVLAYALPCSPELDPCCCRPGVPVCGVCGVCVCGV